jgi:acyl-CoA thioesterase
MNKPLEEQIKEYFEKESGWIKYNGLQIDEITKEKVTTSVVLNQNHLNPHGIAHGGLIFGLADSSMGILASLTGRKVVTVDSTINYLRPCGGNKIVCIAEPVKVGMTLGVYKANIYNDKDDLAATVTASFFFLDREIKK